MLFCCIIINKFQCRENASFKCQLKSTLSKVRQNVYYNTFEAILGSNLICQDIGKSLVNLCKLYVRGEGQDWKSSVSVKHRDRDEQISPLLGPSVLKVMELWVHVHMVKETLNKCFFSTAVRNWQHLLLIAICLNSM